MTKNHKRLKLNIKGRNIKGIVKSRIYNYFLQRKLNKHNLKPHKIEYKNKNHLEIIVDGEREQLWNIVHYNRRGPMFCEVDEVVFEFSEVTV